MLRVALTGGVGSGKSAAAAMLRASGCFVSQSDEVARRMMQPDEPVFDEIVRVFGAAVVQTDGALDRAALARLAFREGRADELNAIVHPAVIEWQAAWLREMAATQPRAVAVVESALVFETRYGVHGGDGLELPWRTRFDRVVLVTAAEETRVRRYLVRVGASDEQARHAAEADVRARMLAQRTDAEKAALSDFVIANDGTLDDLRAAVDRVWRQLRAEAEDGADKAM